MNRTERKLLVVIAALLIASIIGIVDCSNKIDRAGGMKNIIIDAGKEIKDISKQIDQE